MDRFITVMKEIANKAASLDNAEEHFHSFPHSSPRRRLDEVKAGLGLARPDTGGGPGHDPLSTFFPIRKFADMPLQIHAPMQDVEHNQRLGRLLKNQVAHAFATIGQTRQRPLVRLA